VAPGRRTAADVVPAERIRTPQGGFLTKKAGSATLVNALGRAMIVAADATLVSNGAIHVIDTVVLRAVVRCLRSGTRPPLARSRPRRRRQPR
jgi:uncharacterized surface protein with fasciclin (FAS1) repeats